MSRHRKTFFLNPSEAVRAWLMPSIMPVSDQFQYLQTSTSSTGAVRPPQKTASATENRATRTDSPRARALTLAARTRTDSIRCMTTACAVPDHRTAVANPDAHKVLVRLAYIPGEIAKRNSTCRSPRAAPRSRREVAVLRQPTRERKGYAHSPHTSCVGVYSIL